MEEGNNQFSRSCPQKGGERDPLARRIVGGNHGGRRLSEQMPVHDAQRGEYRDREKTACHTSEGPTGQDSKITSSGWSFMPELSKWGETT